MREKLSNALADLGADYADLSLWGSQRFDRLLDMPYDNWMGFR